MINIYNVITGLTEEKFNKNQKKIFKNFDEIINQNQDESLYYKFLINPISDQIQNNINSASSNIFTGNQNNIISNKPSNKESIISSSAITNVSKNSNKSLIQIKDLNNEDLNLVNSSINSNSNNLPFNLSIGKNNNKLNQFLNPSDTRELNKKTSNKELNLNLSINSDKLENSSLNNSSFAGGNSKYSGGLIKFLNNNK